MFNLGKIVWKLLKIGKINKPLPSVKVAKHQQHESVNRTGRVKKNSAKIVQTTKQAAQSKSRKNKAERE